MSVEVKLELGHKAILRDKPTVEGFTHDWTVFVKGCEGSNIYHFVDKVVFHLHESFPKPKRVVKEPPYQVSECGYAGFIMPIEVYFRSKEEPKKVRFEYDLYLRLEGEPVHNIRLEKLTFQNPSEDFRRKLLKARSERSQTSGSSGVPGGPPLPAGPEIHTEESHISAVVHTKPTPAIPEKKPRSHAATKEPSKTAPAPLPPPPPPAPKAKEHKESKEPFDGIFGSPIKTKHSPEPNTTKSKETVNSTHQKQTKPPQPATNVPAVNIARKEPKPIAKENNLSEAKPKVTPKPEKDSKSTAKRSLPSGDASSQQQRQPQQPQQQQQSQPAEKKKKLNNSSSSSSGKSYDNSRSKEEKKDTKPVSKLSSNSVKKDKSKNGTQHKEVAKSKSPKVSSNQKLNEQPDSKSASYRVPENVNDPPVDRAPAPSASPDESYHSASPVPKETGMVSPMSSDVDEDDDLDASEKSDEEEEEENGDNEEDEDDDDEEDNVKADDSPKKVEDKVPTGHIATEQMSLKGETPKPKAKTLVKKHCVKQNGCKLDANNPVEEKSAELYHQELIDIQKRIMSMTDQQQLQRIVDAIEKTGKFHVTTSSFDFDLCRLDQETIRLLKSYL